MLIANKQNSNLDGDYAARGDFEPRRNLNPFVSVSQTPAGHFDLYFLAAAAHVLRNVVRTLGTFEAAFGAFPFLQDYNEKLAGYEPDDLLEERAFGWWLENLAAWEKRANGRLPLRDLRDECGLSQSELILLMCAGLVEEDVRFGGMFETLHEIAGQRRPTVGLLNAWHDETADGSIRDGLRNLNRLGLIRFGNTENARPEWTPQPNAQLWDVLRRGNQAGEIVDSAGGWTKYEPPENLQRLDSLIISSELRRQLEVLPRLIEQGEIQGIIVRGAHRNGRKTILGALARSLRLGLLEINGLEQKDDERWKTIGTLAVLLRAMPVFRFDIAPSETQEIPAFSEAVKVFGVTLGKQGGLSGAGIEKALTITVKLPDEADRREHWRASFEAEKVSELPLISERFRLSTGNIRRVARLARSYAALDNRKEIGLCDVQQATRALNRQALDTLASHLAPVSADWSYLAVREDTMRDLIQLEDRCRVRERLGETVGAALRGQLQPGVRALFCGASGTGKTFAARLLAAALQKDLYRLDLSTVVNKYIGETEKNLAKVFALVEELDVILLLDEGDALLTQRTSVGSANDRYANLETNYLLQRLESFEGILIVTTNAGDRIDSAFQRRMDSVVEFAPPGIGERRQIWQLHLPEEHDISETSLREISRRCELSGGQIRNVALHAAALALGQNSPLSEAQLTDAIRREYRKTGTICPLRKANESIETMSRW